MRSIADAFTNEVYPARNYGGSPKIVLDNTGSSINRGYLGFSLKSLPTDGIVNYATLRVYLRNSWTGANTITARRITGRWAESTLDFGNAPTTTATGTVDEVVTGGVPGELVEIDVTDMVVAALAGANWHGIRLTVATSGSRNIHSRQSLNRALRPKLIIEYGNEPTPPTELRPHSTNAVDAAFPTLSWDVDSQSYSWVQIATSDDFVADLEWEDTDWVANTEPLYDLSTSSYPGVPDDSQRWWRVKFKDEDGNASEFSDSATFTRRTYGTFVIDSPAADGDPINTSTPTILTTFTGRTLTRIDWYLERLDVGADTYVDVFPNRIPDGTSIVGDFEISGVKVPAATYKLTLRAFDEYSGDRGSAVGETTYVKKVRTFVYAPGATSPVTGLAVVPASDGSPILSATWSRASAPDSFSIYVNGVLTETVDSGDAFVSGTSYAWTIYTAQPRVLNTIEVVATDAGIDSDPASVGITLKPTGIWMIAPDDGLTLHIHGQEAISADIAESGTTYHPLSGTPVRILDSKSGLLEGSLSGILVTVGTDTVEDARATFFAIKDLDVSAAVRLVFGRRNILVVLGPFSIEELSFEEEIYQVSAEFWETLE